MDSYLRKEEQEQDKEFIEIPLTAIEALLSIGAVGIIVFLAVSLLNYFM